MTIRRLKLTMFELRVIIEYLNEYRLKLNGKDTSDIDDIILQLINIYEN